MCGLLETCRPTGGPGERVEDGGPGGGGTGTAIGSYLFMGEGLIIKWFVLFSPN